jgi:hypothetical protein
MVSNGSYINLYMVKYNCMNVCGLTRHNPYMIITNEFDVTDVTTRMQEKLNDHKCMTLLDCM